MGHQGAVRFSPGTFTDDEDVETAYLTGTVFHSIHGLITMYYYYRKSEND